jgi:hypothetical protein
MNRLGHYECAPPADVLAELARKRKSFTPLPPPPPTSVRAVKPAHGRRGLVLAVLVLVLVAAGVTIALIQHHAPTIAPTVQPTASPQPTASAEPIQPTAAIEHVIEQPIPPPRAQLLKPPPPTPRAQLVRLPSQRVDLFAIAPEHIDQTHDITMPYGTVVRATLRGFLEQENQLPLVGHIGDM